MLDSHLDLYKHYEESFLNFEIINAYCCKYFVNIANILISSIEEGPLANMMNFVLNTIFVMVDEIAENSI